MSPESSWHGKLVLAIEHNGPELQHRFLQLATVRSDGTPANRTMVYRARADVHPQRAGLVVTTDARSSKVRDAELAGYGEICWYFAHSREQFRLSGILHHCGHVPCTTQLAEIRERVWRELPTNTQDTFRTMADKDTIPRAFVIVLLDAVWVDYLRLLEPIHQRIRYQWSEVYGWQHKDIDP